MTLLLSETYNKYANEDYNKYANEVQLKYVYRQQ